MASVKRPRRDVGGRTRALRTECLGLPTPLTCSIDGATMAQKALTVIALNRLLQMLGTNLLLAR